MSRSGRIQTICSALALAACLPVSSGAAAEVMVAEAFRGEPFGVATLRVSLDQKIVYEPDVLNFRLSEKDGRALYPVYTTENSLLSTSSRLTLDELRVDFLFRGNDPLELTLQFDNGKGVTRSISPVSSADQHDKALRKWWGWYSSAAQDRARADGYPPQVENYLVSMLAPRLGMPAPAISNPWSGQQDLDQALGLLMGAESVRAAMQRDTFLKDTDRLERPTEPLPDGVTPPSISIPDIGDAKVEAIAAHVPAECFYVRCRTFKDFLWLRGKIEQLGGSLRNLTAVRGLDYNLSRRMETQLALEETVLSRLLGDAVISDVAIVGTDTFFREGASYGILFEARSNFVLSDQLKRLRRDALARAPGAGDRAVTIAGRKVSLLSTPDNRVRSFYAVDGDYHFITTSRRLVERFYEAGEGRNSLASINEFHYARKLMPADRGDAVFIYLSDPFFREIVGPKYRVEMTRRMQALAEIELVYLARQAARAERQPHETIEQLIAADFLPENFTTRADGSRAMMDGGAVVDSLRGARGAFLPIPDVEVASITPSEERAYNNFSVFYRRQWERMDPVIVGVQRRPLQSGDAEREKIVLDVHITPYARQHYGWWPQFLAQADRRRLAPVAGDLGTLQVRVNGAIGRDGTPDVAALHAFAGFHDFEPSFSIRSGRVVPDVGAVDDVNGYIGTEIDAIRRFGLVEGSADSEGYLEHPSNHWWRWERRIGDWLVVANQKEVLEDVTPQLKLEQAERPAQIRLAIGDLANTKAAGILHAMGYLQARRTSAANVQFLNALIEQLQVDPQSARKLAERTLDAELTCPMGGEYQFTHEHDLPRWRSSAWSESSLYEIKQVPDGCRFPLLDLVRGLDVEFSIDQTTLTTRIELELQQTGK